MRTVEERFWQKVEFTDSCWLWTAANYEGYGKFMLKPRTSAVQAHRLAYEMLIGPIPEGLQLDHLCRVHACVNPSHLEPVTSLENSRRGHSWEIGAEKQRAKTHCPSGHSYSGDNVRINRAGGRVCRACQRRHVRNSLIRRRAIGAA